MIAILIAMEQELQEFKKNIEFTKKESFFQKNFYFFTYKNKEYILAETGIGSVNASITTAIICMKYKVDFIINFGAVGSIDKNANIHDLILIDKALNFDYNLSIFGRELGEIPNEKLFFECSKKLIKKFTKILNHHKINFEIGSIATGSTFITNKNINNFRFIKKKKCYCADMETAGILQSCKKFNIEAISFKYISDGIFFKNSKNDFNKNIKTISLNIWNLFKIIG